MQLKDKKTHGPFICGHTYYDYLEMVTKFHGYVAPGLVIGGFMVDMAYGHLPEGELFDALCETRACLPDAIQLLTPCTVGNGWLKIVDIGRYALALYEKRSGTGIRVYVDAPKLEPFPELKTWFFKLKPKKEQNTDLLLEEIRQAGSSICSFEPVRVDPEFMGVVHREGFSVCPSCGEGYPTEDGPLCRGCGGQLPYLKGRTAGATSTSSGPVLRAVPVEAAEGLHALHDMTQIIPGKTKGAAFKRNHKIAAEDICRLQKMGRQTIYVSEDGIEDSDWIHEDEAARAFAKAMAGKGIVCSENPSEGKMELSAARNGLFLVDEKRLEAFNLLPDMKCAGRQGYTVVSKGAKLAGTRALPLYINRAVFEKGMAVLKDGPLFEVLPLRKANVGILVTGTEVFLGQVEDRFIPTIRKKVVAYGCSVAKAVIVPDDRRAISDSVKDLLTRNVDLLVTTAGLSVDPDDVTRQGLIDAGVLNLRYGAPILPGNMTLLADIDRTRIIGVPACALYHKITSFDLLLPRLLAGLEVTNRDLAGMGHGGMCLDCKPCTFPKCTFGK
jgi:formylmethanofuran dehydrogenase subunit E